MYCTPKYTNSVIIAVLFIKGATGALLLQPSFVSPWVNIQSQVPGKSQASFRHGFGELPIKVVAEVKVTIGGRDYVFNGIGSGQVDDDDPTGLFGGVICLYDDNNVKVYAPFSVSNPIGRIAYTGGSGWSGPLNPALSELKSGYVRVKAWKAWDFPKPDFYHPWTALDVLNPSLRFFEIEHDIDGYPDYVIVQINGTRSGMVGEAQGSISVLQQAQGHMCMGGVMYGYSDSAVRVWAPVYGPLTTSHTVNLISTSDGWSESFDWVYDGQGYMHIYAWKFDEPPAYSMSTLASNLNFEQPILTTAPGLPVNTESRFELVETQVLHGKNEGYRFPGVGSVANNGYFGDYGGLIYARYDDRVFLWRPMNGSTKGYLFHLSSAGLWGTPSTYQSTNYVNINIKIWEQYTIDEVVCPLQVIDGFESATNANVTIRGVGYMDTLKIQCKTGYRYILGNTTAVCNRYSEWDGLQNDSFLCEFITCNLSTLNSPNARVSANGNFLGDIVTHECDEGYRYVSGNILRECLYSGAWSGTTPVCEVITCDLIALTAPNTQTNINGNFLGDIVTYECKTGYRYVSGQMSRECLNSGNWSGATPVCEEITCDLSALASPNTETNINGNFLGDIVTYECKTAYRYVSGQMSRECLDSGDWSGATPVCEAITCELSALSSPNTQTNINGNLLGDTVTYECNTGYRYVSGQMSRECLDSGEWNGAPPVCEALPSPNTQTNINGNFLGDTVTYECKTGYRYVSGQMSRECLDSGVWSGVTPVCEVMTCDSSALTSPNTQTNINGNLVGDIVTYECNTGYRYVRGEMIRVCLHNGVWSGATPVCEVITCDVYALASPNTQVTVNSNFIGDVVTYQCDTGYRYVVGDMTRECLSTGTWIGIAPVCEAVTCPSDQLIVPFSNSTISGTKVGDTVSYTCHKGFPHISGDLTRTCQEDGTWSGQVPLCEYCICPCYDNRTAAPTQTLQDMLEDLKEELTVEPSKTSLAIRKKISVYDDRPSARGLGVLGVTILVGVLLLILIPDLPRIISDIKH